MASEAHCHRMLGDDTKIPEHSSAEQEYNHGA